MWQDQFSEEVLTPLVVLFSYKFSLFGSRQFPGASSPRPAPHLRMAQSLPFLSQDQQPLFSLLLLTPDQVGILLMGFPGNETLSLNYLGEEGSSS